MERENNKGILFGVLGVMTLVIAILGASLAYFTAVDRSEEEVKVEAATVTINYVQGRIVKASNLIPATKTVVQTAYAKQGEKQCLDSNGKQVCSVFAFEAQNNGPDGLAINGKIITTTQVSENNGEDGLQTKEFENLSYMVYDVTSGTPVPVNQTNKPEITFAQYGGSTELFTNGETGNTVTVESGHSNKYEILIWLQELAEKIAEEDDDPETTTESILANDPNGVASQNDEQGLTYAGIVEIAVAGASDKITGK